MPRLSEKSYYNLMEEEIEAKELSLHINKTLAF